MVKEYASSQEMFTVKELIEWLSYPFVWKAILAGIFTAVSSAVVGVFVVLRGMSFVGPGLAHSAFAGAVLGFLIGVDPMILSSVFAGLMTLWVFTIEKSRVLKSDVSIGIVFSTSMAFAVLFLGLMKGYRPEVYSYLFGSVLFLRTIDVVVSGIIMVVVLVLWIAFYYRFKMVMLDDELAEVNGVKPEFFVGLIIGMTSAVVVGSLRSVGALLVFSLIIIPPATARFLTRSYFGLFVVSGIISVLCVITGVITSLLWDLPAGAVIVITAFIVFVISYAVSRFKEK